MAADLKLEGTEVATALVLAVHLEAMASAGAQHLLPPHRQAPVAVRALLCAAASLAVQGGGLTPEDVARELEALASRMRSGEAEAVARAAADQILGREGATS